MGVRIKQEMEGKGNMYWLGMTQRGGTLLLGVGSSSLALVPRCGTIGNSKTWRDVLSSPHNR